MEIELSAFSAADGRCPKCLTREAATDWCPPGTLPDNRIPEEIRSMSGEGRDFLRRECACCGYMWYELPLDAPELEHTEEDPQEAEILALRKLVARIESDLGPRGLGYLQADTLRLVSIVARDANEREAAEAEPEEPVAFRGKAEEPEDSIRTASPYFAPLRPDEG